MLAKQIGKNIIVLYYYGVNKKSVNIKGWTIPVPAFAVIQESQVKNSLNKCKVYVDDKVCLFKH